MFADNASPFLSYRPWCSAGTEGSLLNTSEQQESQVKCTLSCYLTAVPEPERNNAGMNFGYIRDDLRVGGWRAGGSPTALITNRQPPTNDNDELIDLIVSHCVVQLPSHQRLTVAYAT